MAWTAERHVPPREPVHVAPSAQPLAFRTRAAIVLGRWLLHALGATWRVRVHGRQPLLDRTAADPRVVYTLWHGQMLPILWAHRQRTGVMITGADNTVLNNTIRGGTAGVATANAAAIMVSGNNADRNRIIANVLVQTAHDGIRVLDGDDLLIDHNTIAANGGDALSFVPTAGGNPTTAANLCIRNNILTGNSGAALRSPANTGIAFNSLCELSLTSGIYGNDQFNNGAVCAGSNCAGCACLAPAPVDGQANFFEYNLAPAFTSTTFGREDFFCIAEAMLIDSGDVVDGDLVTPASQPHDLNGREPGNFVPTAPDIGGREEGAEGCY